MLQPHCFHLPEDCKHLFYQSYILPIFDYCDVVWSGLSASLVEKLEVHHRKVLKLLYCKDKLFPSDSLYTTTRTTPLSTRRKLHSRLLVHKISLNKVPRHMVKYSWFNPVRSTRNAISLPRAHCSSFLKSPIFLSYCAWSSLPLSIKSCMP